MQIYKNPKIMKKIFEKKPHNSDIIVILEKVTKKVVIPYSFLAMSYKYDIQKGYT